MPSIISPRADNTKPNSSGTLSSTRRSYFDSLVSSVAGTVKHLLHRSSHCEEITNSEESDVVQDEGDQEKIQPFEHKFRYSNYYLHLPDGSWQLRYRDGDRHTIDTKVVEGNMI